MAIVLIVFAVTAVNYASGRYFVARGFRTTLEREQAAERDLANSLVSERMLRLKSDASSVAKRLQTARSQEEMVGVMRSQLESHSDFLAFAVFSREDLVAHWGDAAAGRSFLGNSPYLDAAFEGKTVFSTTRVRPEGEPPLVFHVCVPMGDDKVLSATVSGMLFYELLLKDKFWQSGSVFIIDEQGTLIAHYNSQSILDRTNYIELAKTDPSLRSFGRFLKKMISSESGVGSYVLHGEEQRCSYLRVSASPIGWVLAVTTPINERPRADAERGLLLASMLFLIVGVLLAVALSTIVIHPFSKIEEQNRRLEKLHDTVRIQASLIQKEHERIKIMLDAMPLACRLWNRDLSAFECNEAGVKLFKLKDKQESFDRFFDLSPEYQPDGQRSREKIILMLKRAFEGESCVFDWMHQTLDGESIPAEITLVRVLFEDDYVVASYTRDLREHNQMMREIERRTHLLNMVNQVASHLLTPTDEVRYEDSLMESLALIGQCTNVDRVQIWQNEIVDGSLHFVHRYGWLSAVGQRKAPIPIGWSSPYGRHPEWTKKFLRKEYINSPFRDFPKSDQLFLSPREIESLVIIPLFLQNQFWGLLSLDDCHEERIFTDEEIGILRSAGLMMLSAINRQILDTRIKGEHDRIKLLLDAMPLGCNLWDRDLNVFDCNDATVRLFGLRDQREFLDRFDELSPKCQPDGQLSADKGARSIQRAFEDGRLTLEWTHQTPEGAPIPMDVTLVRVAYGGDHVVAGYMRDLREHKQMMVAIERRDHLLNAMNQAAAILLESEINAFDGDMQRCMGMMATAVGLDRVYIGKNSTVDGKLRYSILYDWASDGNLRQNVATTLSVSYNDAAPGWEDMLSQGRCIVGLVREMSPEIQAQLEPQDTVSLFVVPIFLQDQFWGFVGYDDCHQERVFSENEQSILRSGGMLLASAVFRNDMTRSVRTSTVQLEAALEQTRNASRAKSDFLAHMSHEMRTPLNAVIGLSGLTLEAERLGREARTNLEKIYIAGTTLLSTVNDILDISKIEAGKLILVPDEYDVPSLVNDAVTQSILQIKSKPVEFVLNLSEDLPARLYGDELRIKQILSNLLSNAFKYTMTGTVALSLVSVKDRDDVWLTIGVRDTGSGIRPEDLRQLFADYTRFDWEFDRSTEGTGLGLSITKKLAEMMDGSIDVQSEYGKGSVFTARLRQKSVTDTTIGPEMVEILKNFRYSDSKRVSSTQPTRVQLPDAQVLVVDDNITNLDVAKGMMKPYGMRVDCVTSGQEAIKAISEGEVRYDAIFMDHMMPGMDGIEATSLIREIGTDYAKAIPIIALTANAVVGSEKMFLDNGFQAFLSKPIDIGRLDEVVRHWVRGKSEEISPKQQDASREQKRLDGQAKLAQQITGEQRRRTDQLVKQISGIDMEKGLQRFGGNWEALLSVLRSYANNTRQLLEVITQVNEDNLAEYAIIVHGIKGSSRGICANDTADMAEILEKAAKAGNWEFVSKNNTVFLKAISKLVMDIAQVIAGIDASKPRKDKPDEELLTDLLTACENYDMDGVDAAMTTIESHEYEYDDGLIAWLRENIEKMNFEQIKEKLRHRT